jgi:hypothetical protein
MHSLLSIAESGRNSRGDVSGCKLQNWSKAFIVVLSTACAKSHRQSPRRAFGQAASKPQRASTLRREI